MAVGKKNMTTAMKILGGSDPGERQSHTGLLGRFLLPLAPFVVLARFGGFDQHPGVHLALEIMIWLTALVPLGSYLSSYSRHPSKARFLRDWAGSTLFLGVFILAALAAEWARGLSGAEGVAAIGILFMAMHRGALLLLRSSLFSGRPALALGSSFASVILLGSLFLAAAPNATRQDANLSFVDALFTATSATCVTGLEVVSTSQVLSPFGQGIVLFLIQIGGLGIMTLGTFLLLSSGHRLGLSGTAMVRESLNVQGQQGMARLLGAILGFTFFFEALGALCFYFWFGDQESGIFQSVFHAVSAFCNAGFALRTNSFGDFATDPLFNAVGMGLITAGGIGFTVLRELRPWLWQRLRRQEAPRSLSLHTRLVLVTSAALIVVGTLGFFLLEQDGVLRGLGLGESILVSSFQSISARTAGFATVSFSGEASLGQATRFFLMPLMWIGASPGSTGGGLKTVTLAVLVLGVLAQMRRRRHAEVFGRRLPEDQLRQAATIAFLYGVVLCMAVLALLISESGTFSLNEILFESVSAVATVGFSCGLSSAEGLSDFGKLVMTLLMFVGRLGPLTLVFVLGGNRRPLAIEYPEERVMIG